MGYNFASRQPVGTAESSQVASLNTIFEEHDINNKDYGMQRFVYKKITDAGVATAIGSPVGEVQESGGGTVTPDFSDVGADSILGDGGGIAQFVVAAAGTSYGWVQSKGIGRAIMKTTGALAAAVLGTWTDDDTVAVVADGTEEYVFVMNLVAASGGSVAAGGYRLL